LLRWNSDGIVADNVFRNIKDTAITCDADSLLVAGNAFVGCGAGIGAWNMFTDDTPYGGCRLLGNAFWNCTRAFAVRQAAGAVVAGNRAESCKKPSVFGNAPKNPCRLVGNVPAIEVTKTEEKKK